MKRNSRAAVTLCVSAISAVIIFCSAFAAHAGQWNVNYSFSPALMSNASSLSYGYSNSAGCSAACPVQNGVALSSLQATVTATMTWQGYSATDTPPATVSVLESVTDTAHVPGFTGFSVAFDDGLGDTQSNAPMKSMYQTFIGKHLIQAQVVSGKVVLPARTLIVSISAPSSWPSSDSGQMYLLYTAAVDNRGVTLSRPGAVGETTDANGTVHGDTVYSMNNFTSSVVGGQPTTTNSPIINTQTIRSTLSGSWGVRSSWSWSPDYSNGSAVYDPYTADLSGLYYTNGYEYGQRSGPNTVEFDYTCQDSNDGAKAQATYILTEHDQWENWRVDANKLPTAVDTDDFVRVQGAEIGQENHDVAHTMPVGPLTVGGSASATLGFTFNGGFSLADAASFGVTVSPSLSAAFNIGQSISGPDIPPASYITLMYHVHYHQNYYLIDSYTAAGYSGAISEEVDGNDKYIALYWSHPNPLSGSF